MHEDEDDPTQYERLSSERDYADGQWIDGEFFASKNLRGRHQTRDEQLYGVFADGDSDDDDRKGGKGKGKKRGRDDARGGMSFVSGKTQKQDPPRPGGRGRNLLVAAGSRGPGGEGGRGGLGSGGAPGVGLDSGGFG